MYDETIRKLRELASIPAHCENVESCDGCSKEDICLSFTNERIIETASKAADAIEELLAERDEVNADSWKTAFEVERDEHRWIPVTERAGKTLRPVVKAHWYWDPDGMDWGLGAWRCSACNTRSPMWWNCDKGSPLHKSGHNYCPNCGAKMEES